MDRFLKRPAGQTAAGASKRPHASWSAATGGGSRYIDCPICNRSVPLTLINEHLDTGCRTVDANPLQPSPPQAPLLAPSPIAHPSVSQPPLSHSTPATRPPTLLPNSEPSQPSKAAGANAGANAFEALKRGAEALKPRNVHCTLLPGPPPRLVWSTTAVTAEAEWTCEVDLRSTNSAPVKLILHQEMPGSGGALLQGDGVPRPEWFAHSHSGLRISLTNLSVPLLKSALQKNIRLGRPVESVRCAWALLRHVDPTGSGPSGAVELLRRLPIIAFEDGLPPPLLGPLTWLMVAHTAKTPLPLSCMHVNLILAATLQLASCRYREHMAAEAPSGMGGGAPLPSLADLVPLAAASTSTEIAECPGGADDVDGALSTLHGDSEEDEVLEASLALDVARAALLRAAYGGMGGDIAMLHKAVATWAARGADHTPESLAWGARLRGCAGQATASSEFSNGDSSIGRSPSTLEDTIVREALGGHVQPPDASSARSSGGGQGGTRGSDGMLTEAELRLAMRGEGGLRWGDVPLSALDFHCTNVLDQALAHPATLASMRQLVARHHAATAGGEVAVVELGRRAMWACSSAINVKEEWRGGMARMTNQSAAEEGMAAEARGVEVDIIPPEREHGSAITGWLRGVAMSRLGPTTCRAVQAMRWAEAASARAQATAEGPPPRSASPPVQAQAVAWAAEAVAAAAAVAASGESPAEEASLLGAAWAAIAPRCRGIACETLYKLLANERRQREAQQRLLDAMSPALLLEAPPLRHAASVPEPHPKLQGLYLIQEFVSEAEEAALIEWCAVERAPCARAPCALSSYALPLVLEPLLRPSRFPSHLKNSSCALALEPGSFP